MDVESLAQIRQIVTEAVQGVREEMAVLGTDLRSEITDTKRHMGVLTEGLRSELQLVAEAVQLQSERRREVEIQARRRRKGVGSVFLTDGTLRASAQRGRPCGGNP